MKRFSFSKGERITKTSEFRAALKDGLIYRGKAIKLSISPNKLGVTRIGISLRRENFRLATQRNKVRRQFREIFRLNKASFKKDYDIIIIPKADCARLAINELKDEFLDVAGKANILAF